MDLERTATIPPRAFGVGAAKTGTHWLATMFQTPHEPDHQILLQWVLRRFAHRVSEAKFERKVVAILENRNLAFNVSQINGFIIRTIYRAYPGARYVLTVRDADSWLRSFINHQLTRPLPRHSPWHAFRDLRFRAAANRPEEAPLRSLGLYSLDAYLGYWADHTAQIVDTVPADQLCIVSTSKLTSQRRRLVAFVGMPAAVRPGQSHTNRGAYKPGPLDDLPLGYIQERTQAYTSLLLSRVTRRLSGDQLKIMRDALFPDQPSGGSAPT